MNYDKIKPSKLTLKKKKSPVKAHKTAAQIKMENVKLERAQPRAHATRLKEFNEKMIAKVDSYDLK